MQLRGAPPPVATSVRKPRKDREILPMPVANGAVIKIMNDLGAAREVWLGA